MQFGWTADEPASFAVLDALVAAGGNFLGTADIYSRWAPGSPAGKTEEIIGRWLKSRGHRQDLVIATKVRGRMLDGPNGEGLSRHRVVRGCEYSLRRLQTDDLDLYQCHRADTSTPIDETHSALDDLARAGEVRYLGASNHPAGRLMEAEATAARRGLARFERCQPECSLMTRDGFEVEAMAFCRHYGVSVIPYSPSRRASSPADTDARRPTRNPRGQSVAAWCKPAGFAVIDALDEIGRAHGRTVGQTALAWLLTNPVVPAPIIGANSVPQLEESLGACGYRLAPEGMARLNQVTDYPRNWRPIWD